MPLFTWKDDYSVGVGTFDGHHKRLFDLINELHDAMRTRKASEALGGILLALIDYTRMHFGAEEDRMASLVYPGYAEHKKEHEKFVKEITDFKAKLDAANFTISIGLMVFLKDWLVNHIMVTDKQYTRFFNDKGVV
ncbi:MAG: hemerythrin family protein [Deltaproteobacteria bacterium]|nr:hemerythrin family protein [Deltaproteobacteria bacterium]